VRAGRAVAVGGALLLAVVFAALGTWQIERRAWKLDLIARVDARLAAAPTPLPSPAEWPGLTRDRDEYRRLAIRGRFLPDRSVRVMAVTTQGPGSWLLAPFRTEGGDIVLVNRGFVPPGWTPPAEDDPTETRGLLRFSEPGGGFLRRNEPAAGRWYSRDVEAIAAALGLGPVAPFFIDADESGNGPGRPVGGLTVTTFRNSHLVYALTWFALAAMSVGAAVVAWRMRRGQSADGFPTSSS
jgi:surfeit locus 1 family protein